MKKYIFKKTAGIMIVASMLCAMLTTGCAQSDSNADNKEIATQAVTETTTEAKEPVIVKAGAYDYISDIKVFDFGITVEGTNSNYECLATSSVAKSDNATIIDEQVKDIISISMQYKNYELLDNSDVGYSEVNLNETVKVSIPYEEGMYILTDENGVAYDIDAEYIDGKYVFETNTLGEFIISTTSTGRTAPTKIENVELAQQTIIDESTGVQVSGMLPVDAKMHIELNCIDDSIMSDRYDFPYLFENDYPKATNVSDYYFNYISQVEDIPIASLIDHEGWAEEEVTMGGKLNCYITFIKDFEILDFESDLTVTLPFDYHNALAISQVFEDPGKAKVVQYDYDKKEFITQEVIPAENTEQGKFQFKTKTPGTFLLGGEVNIDGEIDYYIEQSKYEVEEN